MTAVQLTIVPKQRNFDFEGTDSPLHGDVGTSLKPPIISAPH